MPTEVTFSYGTEIGAWGLWADASGIGGAAWSDLVTPGTGVTGNRSSGYPYPIAFYAHTVSEKWLYLWRLIIRADATSLPDDCTILSATLKVKIDAKANPAGWSNLKTNVVALTGTPSDDASDFILIGNTELCDTPVTYEGWNTSDWNEFELNSDGLAEISKTGQTYLGMKEITYDKGDTSPAWASGAQAYIAPTAEPNGFDIELVVTYSSGSIYPSEGITRVTSLTHRYVPGSYTLEMSLGEIVADFGMPDMDIKPASSMVGGDTDIAKAIEKAMESGAGYPEPPPEFMNVPGIGGIPVSKLVPETGTGIAEAEYDKIIQQGKVTKALKDFGGVGTPEDLERFKQQYPGLIPESKSLISPTKTPASELLKVTEAQKKIHTRIMWIEQRLLQNITAQERFRLVDELKSLRS